MEQANETETDYVAVVGRRIHHLRDEKNLSQDDLAEKAHISRQFVSKIEQANGRYTMDVFFDIAKALAVAPAVLLSEAENMDVQNELSTILSSCSKAEALFLIKLMRYTHELLQQLIQDIM